LREQKAYTRPFFGKMRILLERINSLEENWYVEFWDEHYFIFGIDVYSRKREVVKVVKIENTTQAPSRKSG